MRKGWIVLVTSLIFCIPAFGFNGKIGSNTEMSRGGHHNQHFNHHSTHHFFHRRHHSFHHPHYYHPYSLRVYVVPRVHEYDVGEHEWYGDIDHDGVVNRYDPDDDGDGYPDSWDFFPHDPNR